MKILIAEDEENIVQGIVSILQSRKEYKCQIRHAENGQRALEIAEQFHPDMVITDIRMFQKTGLELAEELKSQEICDKVVIISGYSRFDYAQQAIRANVLDYLLKPIDKQRLLELVDRVYEELPESYAARAAFMRPAYPFFDLELEKEEYPASLKKAISFIRHNYMKDISLQTLSDELMLHPNYLSSLVNRHTGVNFSYLLDYVRLEMACELLASPEDMTVAEVSYIVGYNNERRLYHAFQKRLNCTPGDFRKSIPERVPR